MNSKVQRITDLLLVKAKVFPAQLKHTKVFPVQLKHTKHKKVFPQLKHTKHTKVFPVQLKHTKHKKVFPQLKHTKRTKVLPVQLKHTKHKKVFPVQLKHTGTLGRDYQQVSLSDKVNPEKETARYFCKGTNRNFRAS